MLERTAIGGAILVLVLASACMPGNRAMEGEYYEAYMNALGDLEEIGSQLDSTLVRIRDLEGAIDLATNELAGAESSAREAQLVVGRDPNAAEYHAVQAQTQLQRARTVLQGVRER